MHSASLFSKIRRWGDDPWRWTVGFVNAALVGLLLIAPKYQQREAMLERRYEVRRDAAARMATGQVLPDDSNATADPRALDRPLIVPLWPLAVALVAVDAVALSMLWIRRRRSALAAAESNPP
jgi:hypothetical protein